MGLSEGSSTYSWSICCSVERTAPPSSTAVGVATVAVEDAVPEHKSCWIRDQLWCRSLYGAFISVFPRISVHSLCQIAISESDRFRTLVVPNGVESLALASFTPYACYLCKNLGGRKRKQLLCGRRMRRRRRRSSRDGVGWGRVRRAAAPCGRLRRRTGRHRLCWPASPRRHSVRRGSLGPSPAAATRAGASKSGRHRVHQSRVRHENNWISSHLTVFFTKLNFVLVH